MKFTLTVQSFSEVIC